MVATGVGAGEPRRSLVLGGQRRFGMTRADTRAADRACVGLLRKAFGTIHLDALEPRRLLSGVTYYVSPSAGSDANLGTSAAPFATLQHAADRVGAGDTVVARAGTYAAGFVLGWDGPVAGTAANPIRFLADPGA